MENSWAISGWKHGYSGWKHGVHWSSINWELVDWGKSPVCMYERWVDHVFKTSFSSSIKKYRVDGNVRKKRQIFLVIVSYFYFFYLLSLASQVKTPEMLLLLNTRQSQMEIMHMQYWNRSKVQPCIPPGNLAWCGLYKIIRSHIHEWWRLVWRRYDSL